ncbi:MAG: hypothetical protein OSJ52_12295 [Lachnospiraceae bacterium]|jgi:hypothetical protein|nr:hypothetical protein [Lachnospiraceae bacterium]
MLERNKELVLSHEQSLQILQGLPISKEEALRRRNQIIEDFQESCQIEREKNRTCIDIPDWDLSFIQEIKTAQQNLAETMEKKFFDYRKDEQISIIFSEGREYLPEKIMPVMEQEKKTEYNMELDNIPAAA